MPYANYQDRLENNRGRTQVLILQNRCCHCGKPLPEGYQLKNCDDCITKRKTWGWNQKLRALQKISGQLIPTCKCGISDLRILTINHKVGVGRHDKERGGYSFYKKIIDGSRPCEDLDVRCYNCNILYEFERGTRRFFL